jgi:hypothetical protein
MTPEQIQQAIEGLLSVQRNLQDGQLQHDSRLTQIEQLLLGLGERTETIAYAVERMTDVQLQTFRVIEGMQTDIREMQAEVRGLQTENRRILDRVFGEQSN